MSRGQYSALPSIHRAEERYEKMLAGVVFYESPRSGLRTREIRTHHALILIQLQLQLLHRAGVAPAALMSEDDETDTMSVTPPIQVIARNVRRGTLDTTSKRVSCRRLIHHLAKHAPTEQSLSSNPRPTVG